MQGNVLRIFPTPHQEVPLKGLYLGEDIPSENEKLGRPFVYANFITSLDGRIAVPNPKAGRLTVPEQIANDRDWRLFQELAAQADILITSGRYLRNYIEGTSQEILQAFDDPNYADLLDWRKEHGMAALPDLAVISGSLDFPAPDPKLWGDRSIIIFTGSRANSDRIRMVENEIGEVFIAGEESVRGNLMIEGLAQKGYRSIYNTTGPKVLHFLLADGIVDRLYLTFAHRVLGGDPYLSIVDGPLLEMPVDFRLRSAYLDSHSFDGAGQLITSYERLRK